MQLLEAGSSHTDWSLIVDAAQADEQAAASALDDAGTASAGVETALSGVLFSSLPACHFHTTIAAITRMTANPAKIHNGDPFNADGEGNLLGFLFNSRQVFTGEFPGMPPGKGQELTSKELWLFRLKDGKVAEGWMYGITTGLD